MRLLLISAFLFAPLVAFGGTSAKYTINWFVPHGPRELIQPSIDHITSKLKKESGGEIEVIPIVGSEDLADQHNRMEKALKGLAKGEYQLVQVFTNVLGQVNPDMWALETPYLFRDDAHVFSVLDGAVGKRLSDGVLKRTGSMRPLAYTYSGGFKVLCTSLTKEVKTLEDLKGLRIDMPANPYHAESFVEIGMQLFPGSRRFLVDNMHGANMQMFEAAYPRIAEHPNEIEGIKTIVDSRHSVTISSLVVNEQFYQSLPEKYRRLVEDTVQEGAVIERKNSVRVGEEMKQSLAKMGVKITPFPKAEQVKWASRLTKYRKRSEGLFSKNLLVEIEKARSHLASTAR